MERKLEDNSFAESPRGKAIQRLLDRRIKETHFQVPAYVVPRIEEYYCGWQQRSWDLYAKAAAAAGGKIPTAEEKVRFFTDRR